MATISPQDFLKGGKKITIISSAASSRASSEKTDKPGFFQNVKSDLQTRLQNAKSDINSGINSPSPVAQAGYGFAAGGEAAGAIMDVLGRALEVTKIPQVIGAGVSKIGEAVNSATGGAAGDVLNSADVAYQSWAKKHPLAAKDLAAFGNAAQLASLFVGGGEAKAIPGKVASDGSRVAKSAIEKVGNTVKNTAESALTKVKDAATPIEESTVKTFEGTTLKKFDHYVAQAEKAVQDIKQPTPLELAGDRAQTALRLVEQKLRATGEAKKQVLSSVAKKAPGGIVQDALKTISTGVQERFGGVIQKDGKILSAKGRSLKISESDAKLIGTVKSKLESIQNFPTVQKVDDAIDYIHDALYKSERNLTLPANDQVNGFLREVAGQLNTKLKNVAGEAYSAQNLRYQRILKIKNVLNKALGEDANKGAALMKQLFSPNGTMPRKLFDAVHQLTGIDLAEEASLAKYAMERVGDVRQKSLLESSISGSSLPTSKGAAVSRLINYGMNKLQDPFGKARRIIIKSGASRSK